TVCDREFQDVRAVIAQQHKDAEIAEEGGSPAIAGVAPELMHRTVYNFRDSFSGEIRELRSEVDLYCYVGGRWLVKYRAPSNVDFDVTRDIEQFIRRGPWPGRTPQVEPRD